MLKLRCTARELGVRKCAPTASRLQFIGRHERCVKGVHQHVHAEGQIILLHGPTSLWFTTFTELYIACKPQHYHFWLRQPHSSFRDERRYERWCWWYRYCMIEITSLLVKNFSCATMEMCFQQKNTFKGCEIVFTNNNSNNWCEWVLVTTAKSGCWFVLSAGDTHLLICLMIEREVHQKICEAIRGHEAWLQPKWALFFALFF